MGIFPDPLLAFYDEQGRLRSVREILRRIPEFQAAASVSDAGEELVVTSGWPRSNLVPWRLVLSGVDDLIFQEWDRATDGGRSITEVALNDAEHQLNSIGRKEGFGSFDDLREFVVMFKIELHRSSDPKIRYWTLRQFMHLLSRLYRNKMIRMDHVLHDETFLAAIMALEEADSLRMALADALQGLLPVVKPRSGFSNNEEYLKSWCATVGSTARLTRLIVQL